MEVKLTSQYVNLCIEIRTTFCFPVCLGFLARASASAGRLVYELPSAEYCYPFFTLLSQEQDELFTAE